MHEHPGPPLPTFGNDHFGLPGTTDPSPIAALLGAAAEECGECFRAQVAAVATDALQSAHLAACAFQVLKQRAERTGAPVPPVAELAEAYVSTLVVMFAAFGLGAFAEALLVVQKAEPSKRTTLVEQAAALFVEEMASGATPA